MDGDIAVIFGVLVHYCKKQYNKPEKHPGEKSPNILRGDITRKNEAKMLREKTLMDRQIKRTAAAEEMSGKVMEERELLSLGNRSRATSRATSRAGSPSLTTRKQVTFQTEAEKDNSSSPPNSSSAKSDKSSKNGKNNYKTGNKVGSNGNIKKLNVSSKESTVSFEPINIEVTDSLDQSKSEVNEISSTSLENSQCDTDKHQKDKLDQLSVIEERTSSRCSGKSEPESKRG